jgi:hypothetical protein
MAEIRPEHRKAAALIYEGYKKWAGLGIDDMAQIIANLVPDRHREGCEAGREAAADYMQRVSERWTESLPLDEVQALNCRQASKAIRKLVYPGDAPPLSFRDWLISGGAGHESGESGIRACTLPLSSAIEMADEYLEYRDNTPMHGSNGDAPSCSFCGKPMQLKCPKCGLSPMPTHGAAEETSAEKSLRKLVEHFKAYENGWLGPEVWRNRIGLQGDLAEAESVLKRQEGR